MNRKKERDPSSLNGLSIYHDGKHTVYAPFYSRRAYILTKENAGAYVSYIQGYLVTLLVFVAAYIIYRKIWMPVILASLFLISTFVSFYLNFLRKANVIEDYRKPHRDSFVTRQAASLEEKNILTIIISSPLLAAALMFHSYLNHYEGAMFYIILAVAVVAALYGLLHVYILIYKRNNSRK